MRPLASCRETLSVTKTAIRSNVHQSLDVHGNFAAQISLDPMFPINYVPNAHHFSFLELIDTGIEIDIGLGKDFLSRISSNPIDIGQSDFNLLVFW
jgi:hypothetical protein